MPTNDKQVILISGDSTKWYEQAIFILPKGQAKTAVPKDFLGEAEGIVRNYLRDETTPPIPSSTHTPTSVSIPRRSRRHTNFVLNLMMLLSCAALTIVLALHFFK